MVKMGWPNITKQKIIAQHVFWVIKTCTLTYVFQGRGVVTKFCAKEILPRSVSKKRYASELLSGSSERR